MSTTQPASSLQVPEPGTINLDHVAHFVPDVDRAAAALTHLGFTLTPFSPHSHRLTPEGPLVSAGTGNQCVMFERGFIEVLTPTGETPLADQLRAAISRYVGVHLIAFGTAAAERDHARLAQEGFEPLPPVALERPIGTESGQDTARFIVVRVPPGTMAEGRVQYCQQRTPHLLWQQRWLGHSNGAAALTGVLLCVADPGETAQRYARYTGFAPRARGNAWHIETTRGSLTFVNAVTLRATLGLDAPTLPWIAGYRLAAHDMAETRAFFESRGISLRALGDKAVVALPDALGGIMIFEDGHSGELDLS